MGILANENAISSGGYQISNSLRFQSASTQYLNRTPASAGNRKTWTWSAWVKRGALGIDATIISSRQNGQTDWLTTAFTTSDTLQVCRSNGGTYNLVTTQVFRDPSAWYHIVIAWDTTQATASNRVKLYVNGSQVTAFSTANYPTLNYDGYFNTAVEHDIGSVWAVAGFLGYFDGYMTEINFIDGQALTPSSFGETNTLTGQWVAKKYAGTYGTNGFYLPFSNGTSTTTLGSDSSGNSNNWTLNNFTRSAGTSDCWMIDVPSGNGGVSGTQPASNYAVLNPLGTGGGNVTNANLNFANSANSTNQTRYSTISIPSSGGLIYFEVKVNSVSGSFAGGIGVTSAVRVDGTPPADYSTGWGLQFDGSNVYKRTNSSNTTLYSGVTSTNTYMVAVNTTTGSIWFGRDGTWAGSGDPAAGTNASYTGLTGELTCYVFGYILSGASWNLSANFGQRSFAYTPPSGFKALCTANLPAATIKQGNQYMDATTYTGTNGVAGTVTGINFAPSFVWGKRRAVSGSHGLFDIVRGTSQWLASDLTNAESTASGVTAFNSNGFSYGTSSVLSEGSMVAWTWNAGSSTVTNTNGTISSQVRANPTCGVSVVTYTGTGANATVGHGLGVAPAMVIIKPRNIGSYDWQVWQKSFVTASNTDYLLLNQTVSKGYYGANALWNSTVPSSSVISLGTYTGVNGSTNTYVAYCFAEIAGFSKFGSYTGNGSADGPFVYCGFRPKYIMIKRTDTTSDWGLLDTSRSPYNVSNAYLAANLSNAEVSAVDTDILSNGFKLRTTSLNNSGGTFIYMAFAENPFAQANAR